MKILVTGADGGLARAFLAAVASQHDVEAFDHAGLDIGDPDIVRRVVAGVAPDLICNLAAFTAVDANEDDPDRAFRDNAEGPHLLALAARDLGATLLHVSTDYVFDGDKGAAYDETDEPRPLSVYGRSKLAGERLVRQGVRAHFIVRTGFLFGSGSDYLSSQVARLRRGQPAAGIEDRVGTPTYVPHLAELLVPLALTRRYGTYHLAGPEAMTWYDVLLRCKTRGRLQAAVSPQRAADLGLRASRPANSALTSVLVANLSVPPMPPLDEALTDLLSR